MRKHELAASIVNQCNKKQIWDKYIGRDKCIGVCNTCKREMDSKNFAYHRVIADLGDTMENLIPICGSCSEYRGDIEDMDMYLFQDKLEQSLKKVILNEFFNKYMFMSTDPNISNYDNVLFESIKNLWCRRDAIYEFVYVYQKHRNRESIDRSIRNITVNAPCTNLSDWIHNDSQYAEINKDELIRWFHNNGINVVDCTGTKISVQYNKNHFNVVGMLTNNTSIF